MSTEQQTDPFGVDVLTNSTFKVDWNSKSKVAKHAGNGGIYDAPCILTTIKGYVVPVWVELNRRDYDTLRLLNMQGIKVYTCTIGQKAQGEKYSPRVFAGGKDW